MVIVRVHNMVCLPPVSTSIVDAAFMHSICFKTNGDTHRN